MEDQGHKDAKNLTSSDNLALSIPTLTSASQNPSSQDNIFIGRVRELATIEACFKDPGCRILTLIGLGGIGKTRLAIEAVRRRSVLNDVRFVPLQPLTSPDFMVSAIADAVGFQFYPGSDPKQQLFKYLREKSWLLVLDNFEHLLDGATLLAEILAYAPGVRMLVTSRERLNLVEEWVLDIDGLAYPSSENDREPEHASAVELFVQYARRAKVGFTLTDRERPAITRICRFVGGMPLGIELAAAWVRVVSCEVIADEIGRSLDILETTARNVEPRHRTVRAAFQPTWERLTAKEQTVFMNLAVFRGGFTREAAEVVAGATLRTLSALVDKSLLRVDVNGRYDIHELLRQYGAENIGEAGEADAAIQRHLAYYSALTIEAEAHEFGREQIAWFDRLEVEFDNLRVALSGAVATETGLQIAAALGWFFSERAHFHEGLSWLEQALTANPDAMVSLRAKALHTAGVLAWFVQDERRAGVLCEQALSLARAGDDHWNIAWSLSHLGAFVESDPDQATAMLEESLTLFRALEDSMGVTHTLLRRAWRAIVQQDYAVADPLLAAALLRAREAGDKIITAWVFYWVGTISWLRDHDFRQAKSHYQKSLSLFLEARFQGGGNSVLVLLAGVEQAMENGRGAQMLYEEALSSLWESTDSNFEVALIFVGLANVARTHGQYERAARLLGAANSRDLTHALTNEYAELVNVDHEVENLRKALGELAFADAWSVGSAMTEAQAVAYALEGRSAPIDSIGIGRVDDLEIIQTQQVTSQSFDNPLTARELEVLRLIEVGLTNRDIAAHLFLSPGTVKWYLSEIYSKLDVHSRMQAVVRARELNFLS